ncbi:MAG TPA: membrane protein insertase YidC [Dehalococcoidia bacterium]|nr:protein translocase component YidC [Dehalococcoidia bacterium]HIM17760.1 membrane protein insertase YidC [Dehalococcoidia bacterium]
MEFLGDAWSTIIIQPMVNSLLLLYWVFFSNFGIAIIAFTMLVRLVMVPLTIKQSRQIKAMNGLQPLMKQLQEKYKNDRQRVSQETMKLYKEHGVNPLGCLGPMFIQFPIWIGLFQAIRQTVPNTPETLVELSGNLYSWLPQVHSIIPINSSFLWMDLALPDPSPFVMPILVGGSMFVMQKMTTMPSVDERQASTNRMMLWMMPLMFGFFTLNFSSGLAVYWVVSNIIGVAIQGFITGWDPLKSLLAFGRRPDPATDTVVVAPALASSVEETAEDARNSDNGQNGGRSNRTRAKGARRRSRRGRNRRH